MQPRRIMLLDHKARPRGGRDLGVAGRLCRFLEIALLAVGGKLLERHDDPSR